MTIEMRRDADIVRMCGEAAAIKKQYTDAQEQRTIDAAVGEVTAALRGVEARVDALEARLEQARRDQYLGALKAQLSQPVKAYQLDDRPLRNANTRRYIFGGQP